MADISEQYVKMRAEQILARMPAAMVELPYAFGRTRWDSKLPQPPSWVLRAVQILSKKGGPFEYLQKINKPGDQWTHEEMGIGHGVIQSGLMFFGGMAPAIEKDKKENPLLKGYMDRVAAHIGTALKLDQTKKPNKEDRLPSIENTVHLAEYRKGLSTGSVELCQVDGAPHNYALTYEILLHLWYSWPQVEQLTSVRKLHAWIEFDAGIHCSPKLIEKICSCVGKRFRNRGRPKK